MVYSIFIGAHAFLGEAGALAFLWTFIELLNPTEARVGRAKIASSLGVLFLLLSWTIGGYAYATTYGTEVKPVILKGPFPWAHTIIMEAKEHMFLFLPFLAFVAALTVIKNENEIATNSQIRFSILLLSALIVILAFTMAGMGYMISTGARAALEAGVA